MKPPSQVETASALWRTFGARGLARRAAYEASRRAGLAHRAEERWLAHPAPVGRRLRSLGLSDVSPPPGGAEGPAPYRLYGALDLPAPPGPDTDWHTDPISGRRYPADVHWSAIGDHDPDGSDIKDVWELSRLVWLGPLAARARRDEAGCAERVWASIESWHAANPPYRGVHWLSGQEVALRAISVQVAADLLDADPSTTEPRRALVAGLVQDAVGRVAATLGYALSQRNNHATSEAGFLWGATVLAPWLPEAGRLRRRAALALAEAVEDQFGPDGSYAQHSPTYQRLALHVLLWCLAVERATGEAAPAPVADAVRRSVVHLRHLLVPGSEGRMPNLGGNDGALLFDLADAPVTDFRPLLAHAAAAVGVAAGLEAGPWDAEASWFGLDRVGGSPAPLPPTVATHAVTRGGAHAVLRAGPLRHRPAHADQLHVDVWIDGRPVAVDPGTFRYTAPAPWGNALAGDDVHDVPRRPDAPQAERSGRFFWRRWAEADVLARPQDDEVEGILVELVLPDDTHLRRLLVVADGAVVVIDRTGGREAQVRWNLPAGTEVRTADAATAASAFGWAASFSHAGSAVLPVPADDDPGSGWVSPTYGRRDPCRPVLLRSGREATVVSAFVAEAGAGRLPALVGWGGSIALDRPTELDLSGFPR